MLIRAIHGIALAACLPVIVFANDVAYQSNGSQLADTKANSVPKTAFPHAFTDYAWCAPGIEERIGVNDDRCRSGFQPVPGRPVVDLDRARIFAGAWRPPVNEKPPVDRPKPPFEAKFDIDWLSRAVWPRTRGYLEADRVQFGRFRIEFASSK